MSTFPTTGRAAKVNPLLTGTDEHVINLTTCQWFEVSVPGVYDVQLRWGSITNPPASFALNDDDVDVAWAGEHSLFYAPEGDTQGLVIRMRGNGERIHVRIVPFQEVEENV